jgi:hypothetical protein
MTDLSSRRSNLSTAKRRLLEERLRGINQIPAEKSDIYIRAKQGSIPLSFAQQRLWFLDQLAPNNPFYNCSNVVMLEGRLDLDVFERVINEIVRRHEVLRTRFEVVAGEPVQVIDEWKPLRLEVVDLMRLAMEEREAEARRIMKEEAATGFDLSQGPQLRVKILKLEKERHMALFTMHHIVSDAWSMQVFVREVCALYEAMSEGKKSPLEELEIQYSDYAIWQREHLAGEALEREVRYWKERLKDVAVVELPTDYPRPAAPSYRGGIATIEIGKSLSEGLRRLSHREGATLFMTLMAAFKALLMRYSGQEDIAVGTVIANRSRREVAKLIGFFINTLVMRTDLGGNPSFRELIGREKEVALGAYGRQEVPFEKLVEEINPKRDQSRSPLFQVMMLLQTIERQEWELKGLKVRGVEGETGTAKFDLSLILTEGKDGIAGYLEYSRDLYEKETIERMAGHYANLLKEVVDHGHRPISQLSLLGQAESRQILREWNQTARHYPEDQLIHEQFEQQVQNMPEAVALVFENQQLTYAELSARANQLAHYLRRRGVGPETLVGVGVKRSVAGHSQGRRRLRPPGSELSGGANCVDGGGCAAQGAVG